MFFTLSKVAWALLAPSNLLVLIMVVGMLLAIRRRRLGLTLAVLGLIRHRPRRGLAAAAPRLEHAGGPLPRLRR